MIQMGIKATGSNYILLNHIVKRQGNKSVHGTTVFDQSIDEKVSLSKQNNKIIRSTQQARTCIKK
jgi:hypothetical protein